MSQIVLKKIISITMSEIFLRIENLCLQESCGSNLGDSAVKKMYSSYTKVVQLEFYQIKALE